MSALDWIYFLSDVDDQSCHGASHREVGKLVHQVGKELTRFLNSHIIRAIYQTSYETVDITGAQMVLTMKLTTFAWNVWDGRRPSQVRPNRCG